MSRAHHVDIFHTSLLGFSLFLTYLFPPKSINFIERLCCNKETVCEDTTFSSSSVKVPCIIVCIPGVLPKLTTTEFLKSVN
jgi:hypothetical protein